MKDLRYYSQQFRKHWLEYVLLFGGLALLNQFIVMPIFRWLTSKILQMGEIPFVSLQNTITICREHPLVVLMLFLELGVLLVIAYGQLTFLFQGAWQLANKNIAWWQLIKSSLNSWRKLDLRALLLLFGYLLLITPVVDLIFRTPLLVEIQLPQFIGDYLTRNIVLVGGLIVFYLLMSIVGLRLIVALPLMILRQKRAEVAMRQSWQLTSSGRWRSYCWQIIIILLSSTLVVGVLYFLIYCCQLVFDLLPGKYPFYFAVGSLFLLQLISGFCGVWAGTVSLWVSMRPLKNNKILSRPLNRSAIIPALLLLTVLGLNAIVGDYWYLTASDHDRPLTISHRGVAEKNGVPNTIPALKKTSQLHPDYVEMDLHETKDHQFVVVHDENLEKLTGIDKKPAELTLHELTRLTARENGYESRIASFDQYLAVAEQYHQKLLVEIKTTPTDSSTMLQRFNDRYGQRLIKDHDLVHSLDYSVVTKLTKLNSQLPVLYVQPYDLGDPDQRSAGFSMEYSTLSQNFIRQAQQRRQPVFAWTVNNFGVMQQMLYNHVNGIITDNLATLNAAIADFNVHQSYANRILNYILVFPPNQGFKH